LSQNSKDPIAAHLKQSLAALERANSDAPMLAAARAIASAIITALRAGNKLLIVGNGGSAGDAQHIAAESSAATSRTGPAAPRSRSRQTLRR